MYQLCIQWNYVTIVNFTRKGWFRIFLSNYPIPRRDRDDKLDSDDRDVDKVDFDEPDDAKEVLEAEGDNFLNPFLQAKVWLNTKQIIAKIKRVFLNMSKR